MSTDYHDSSDADRTVIREGRNFEQEYRLTAADAGEFLVRLGEQLRDGDDLTLTDDAAGWELSFAFGEPVGLEVDFEGTGETELEIEVEIPGVANDVPPAVE